MQASHEGKVQMSHEEECWRKAGDPPSGVRERRHDVLLCSLGKGEWGRDGAERFE